jgi:DNA-binding response OmpR family regulator
MILLVDDDESMTDTCSLMLEAHGYEVCVADNGSAALSQMHSGDYELLISDCMMPGMSGMELSDQMKADPATAQCPILLMSASMRCDIAPGNSYDAFLRKPFLAESLLFEVDRLIRRATAAPVL